MGRGVVLIVTLLAVLVTTLATVGGAASASATALKSADAKPSLPRILSARIVTGHRYGTVVRVSYCFRTLPKEPARKPAQLHLTVENLSDDLPPLSVGWQVKKRCATVNHPVGPIKPPYLLRYSVMSQRGTWSKRAQMRLH